MINGVEVKSFNFKDKEKYSNQLYSILRPFKYYHSEKKEIKYKVGDYYSVFINNQLDHFVKIVDVKIKKLNELSQMFLKKELEYNKKEEMSGKKYFLIVLKKTSIEDVLNYVFRNEHQRQENYTKESFNESKESISII